MLDVTRGWTGFGLKSHTDRHHTLLARTFLYSNFSLFCVVKNYDWLDRQQWILTDWHENFFSLSTHTGMEAVSVCWARPQMDKFTFLAVIAQRAQWRTADRLLHVTCWWTSSYMSRIKTQQPVYWTLRQRWIQARSCLVGALCEYTSFEKNALWNKHVSLIWFQVRALWDNQTLLFWDGRWCKRM